MRYGIADDGTVFTTTKDATEHARTLAAATDRVVTIWKQPSKRVGGVPLAPYRYADVHPDGCVVR